MVLAWGISLGSAAWPPSPVYGDTKIIPTAALSERYDTNVYLAPPELLAPGTRLSDFVTSVAGGVQLLHKSRDVEASLTGGVNLNFYVYNPDLNFLGTSADANAKLDGWVSRLAEGAKLQVSDRFQYTPEPPSFITARQTPAETIPLAGEFRDFGPIHFRIPRQPTARTRCSEDYLCRAATPSHCTGWVQFSR